MDCQGYKCQFLLCYYWLVVVIVSINSGEKDFIVFSLIQFVVIFSYNNENMLKRNRKV